MNLLTTSIGNIGEVLTVGSGPTLLWQSPPNATLFLGNNSNGSSLNDVSVSALTTGQVLAWNGTAWVNSTVGGTGTVTSVALSVGTGLTVTGSPITTSGTITLNLNANIQGLASLGTANQILSVNTAGTGLEYRTVTAGTGISVTPATGSLTISNTGVTSVAASTTSTGLTIGGSPITTTGTLSLH